MPEKEVEKLKKKVQELQKINMQLIKAGAMLTKEKLDKLKK